jgi:hypothetical protein
MREPFFGLEFLPQEKNKTEFSWLTGSLLNLKVHKSGKKTQGLELQLPWPVI